MVAAAVATGCDQSSGNQSATQQDQLKTKRGHAETTCIDSVFSVYKFLGGVNLFYNLSSYRTRCMTLVNPPVHELRPKKLESCREQLNGQLLVHNHQHPDRF